MDQLELLFKWIFAEKIKVQIDGSSNQEEVEITAFTIPGNHWIITIRTKEGLAHGLGQVLDYCTNEEWRNP